MTATTTTSNHRHHLLDYLIIQAKSYSKKLHQKDNPAEKTLTGHIKVADTLTKFSIKPGLMPMMIPGKSDKI